LDKYNVELTNNINQANRFLVVIIKNRFFIIKLVFIKRTYANFIY